MTLHRLSAGNGYQYLLRHTASGDVSRDGATTLVDYYASSGYPAGQWLGRGLAGLTDDGRGLTPGSVVTEAQMAQLFGSGRNPVTGDPLGRPYRTFAPVHDRIARRVADLPPSLSDEQRADAIAEIERAESQRTQPAAVAGFDLTFTVPKSASVLWGLGGPREHTAVYEAHQAAVSDVLRTIEDRALFTRTGKDGCAQVPVKGLIAASFVHWDTRNGDPNLHSHVVIANKVQDEHGAWRSLDSRTLHQAAVFASELYDDLVADHLAARLPVRWSWRDRGERRTPAFEVEGVSDAVLAAFSTRSADIDIAVQRAVKDFTLTHGRRPNRREVVRLRQTATLETRPTKKPHSLSELTARWSATARRVAGREPVEITDAMLMGHDRRRLRNDRVGDATVTRLANAAVADVMERRSTWTDWNLLASAARVTRGLRMVSTAHRLALVDRVHTEAQRLSTRLDPDDPVRVPAELTRPDGASIFTRAGETRYSHPQLLAAEQRLLDANGNTDGPRVPEPTVRRVLASIAVNGLGSRPRLATDQAAAIRELATSGRALDVLVGPAGTGKTTTLLGLRIAWEAVHGQGSVVGLAPSATAAHELATALGIHCENVAKWLTETAPARQAERDELLADIPARRAAALANGDVAHVRRLDYLGARLQADRDAWTLRPGQLMVVDEASLAGTLDLDRLREQAASAGAKLLLVGDHAQLSAVDAGGAFRLLARTTNRAELTSLWRFQNRWEADASLRLRRGDLGAIDVYDAHGRIHSGPAESMLDHAYDAWAADERAGHTTLLIAPDNRTAVALNERAHLDRIANGSVTGPTVGLGAPGCGPDRGHVGVGDRIITRHNDRSLPRARSRPRPQWRPLDGHRRPARWIP